MIHFHRSKNPGKNASGNAAKEKAPVRTKDARRAADTGSRVLRRRTPPAAPRVVN